MDKILPHLKCVATLPCEIMQQCSRVYLVPHIYLRLCKISISSDEQTVYMVTKSDTYGIVPESVDMSNRRAPPALDWQTWRRQLNHTCVDSDFTV